MLKYDEKLVYGKENRTPNFGSKVKKTSLIPGIYAAYPSDKCDPKSLGQAVYMK